jgi:ribose-phosphate pyrophosphokinase
MARQRTDMENLVLLAGTANRPLAESIARELKVDLGRALVGRFRDGEVRVQIEENVRGRDVYVIQSTPPPAENWDELFFLIDAARRGSAASVTAVVPYLGYARQERKDEPGVPIALKVKMDHLVASGAGRIVTMDMHSAAAQGFVNIPVDHLYGAPLLLDDMAWLFAGRDRAAVRLASDLGYSKIAAAYARLLGFDFVASRKTRRPNEVTYAEILGEVAGAEVLFIDDMVDTGGTLLWCTEAIKRGGPRSIWVAVTHAVLGEGWDHAERGIIAAPVDGVVFTDTLLVRPAKLEKLAAAGKKIRVVSVAGLFARSIREIQIRGSVRRIFEDWEERLRSIAANHRPAPPDGRPDPKP